MVNIGSRSGEQEGKLKSRHQVKKLELCRCIEEEKRSRAGSRKSTFGPITGNVLTSGEPSKYSGVKRPSRPGSKSSRKKDGSK